MNVWPNRHRTALAVVAAVVLWGMAAGAAKADSLLVNGSFENSTAGTYSSSAQTTSAGIPAWFYQGVIDIVDDADPAPGSADSLIARVSREADGDRGRLQRQEVFDVGVPYVLSFYYRAADPLTSVQFSVTGGALTSYTAGADWQYGEKTLQFSGSGPVSAAFSFAHTASMAASGTVDGFELDEVRLTAAPVPLPAAAWGGVALMGLVGAKRLRRREPRA